MAEIPNIFNVKRTGMQVDLSSTTLKGRQGASDNGALRKQGREGIVFQKGCNGAMEYRDDIIIGLNK